jgi:hypothetical protein
MKTKGHNQNLIHETGILILAKKLQVKCNSLLSIQNTDSIENYRLELEI